jgi:hypothetical protein
MMEGHQVSGLWEASPAGVAPKSFHRHRGDRMRRFKDKTAIEPTEPSAGDAVSVGQHKGQVAD